MQSPTVAELLSSSTAAEAAVAIGLSPLCPLPAALTPDSGCPVPCAASGPPTAGDRTPAAQAAPCDGRTLAGVLTLALASDRWALDEGRALDDLPPFDGAMLKELAGMPAVNPNPGSGGGASCGSGGSGGGAPAGLGPCGFVREAGEFSADPPCFYA